MKIIKTRVSDIYYSQKPAKFTMMTHWQTFVNDPVYAGQRVFFVTVDAKRYWIKRAGKDFKNSFQQAIAGHANPLRDEAAAIQALQRRGMRVPTVMHEEADFIVLSDIGESIQQQMQANEAGRSAYVEKVAATLTILHRAGGWHGNAMLRNFTMEGDAIGMIDFEDTAHHRWSLTLRQAFDIWQVLYSAARFDGGEGLARTFLSHYQPSSRSLRILRLIALLLSPLYLLLWGLKPWLKRDIRQAVVAIGALLFHRA